MLDTGFINKTFKKVIPLFINEFVYSFALILIFQIYSQSGDKAVAAVNIADTVSQVVFIFANGLGTATSIFVGHLLGQNELEGAGKNADYLIGYSFFTSLIIFVFMILSGFIIPGVYNIGADTRQLTMYILIIQAFFAPMLIVSRTLFFIIRSGGKVKEVLIVDGLFMWVVKVPVALLFHYVFKANIVFIILAVEFTRVINALLSIMIYRQKKWQVNLTVSGEE